MKIKTCIFIALCIAFNWLFIPYNSFAQPYKWNPLVNNQIKLSGKSILSSQKELPFWQRVNNYGEIPDTAPALQLKSSIIHEYDSLLTIDQKLQKFGWGYGVTGVLNLNQNSKAILSEAYLKFRWKKLEFYGGRRKEIFGLVDTLGTSGSYIWSGNALPMPKVQIHTPGYIRFKPDGILGVKAGLSHGWFGNKDPRVQNHWLHQKWLFGQIGRPSNKVNFQVGITHEVMWGGYSEELKNITGPYPPTINGYLAPYPWYSYQYVILPFLQKFKTIDPNKVPGYDGGLAIGNQLGSVDMMFNISVKNTRLKIYKQQPFDFARSIINMNNIEDGLYGIGMDFAKNKIIQNITLEYFSSMSHGRYRFGKINDSNYGEVDNYFSHGQYGSYSYQKDIIGTPFILRNAETQRIANNRLKYIYICLNGGYKKLSYHLKNAYSINYGTWGADFYKTQNSMILKVDYLYNVKSSFSLELANDIGNLYPNNTGIQAAYSISL